MFILIIFEEKNEFIIKKSKNKNKNKNWGCECF